MMEYLEARDALAEAVGHLIGRVIIEAEALGMNTGSQEATEILARIARATAEWLDTGEAGTLTGWPENTARLKRASKHMAAANKVWR